MLTPAKELALLRVGVREQTTRLLMLGLDSQPDPAEVKAIGIALAKLLAATHHHKAHRALDGGETP